MSRLLVIELRKFVIHTIVQACRHHLVNTERAQSLVCLFFWFFASLFSTFKAQLCYEGSQAKHSMTVYETFQGHDPCTKVMTFILLMSINVS
jgi:hypothetical protein